MARIDTLANFLTDIANSIREKKGTTEKIIASNFDSEIQSIETGGTRVSKGIVINSFDENGFATDVSIVGMTEIPSYYLYYASYSYSSYKSWMGSIGENLHLPDDITKIGTYSFDHNSLLELSKLPDNIASIGSYAFSYCSKLALTKLPSKLTSLGSNAFQFCSKLKLTNVPSGVTKIDSSVFRGCTSLDEITIDGNITSIGSYAFNGCTKLNKLALPNVTSVPTLTSSSLTNTPIANGTGYVYVPDELLENFKTTSNWSTYASQIKSISEMEV